ncbi:uncharacterized protein VICG_01320 [Vittaforma corneae ATCC 50505]|uniref:Uncharacterized protein n=1 Tax=Vittaforma corneae (strain ATCC 50505) TaxID=993615 RepID=L2GN07_VITCO|nr:uncharacterized protein VICG_01320 [Vittaforma corneae ATCC 50505]ELA41687.1 hypothetical protein VICG_01320 [Vittaforma corneae ATCC 50505]
MNLPVILSLSKIFLPRMAGMETKTSIENTFQNAFESASLIPILEKLDIFDLVEKNIFSPIADFIKSRTSFIEEVLSEWKNNMLPYFESASKSFQSILNFLDKITTPMKTAMKDYNNSISSFLTHASIVLLYLIPMILIALSIVTYSIKLDQRGHYSTLFRTLPFICFHTAIHFIPSNALLGLDLTEYFKFLETFPFLKNQWIQLISSIALAVVYLGFTRVVSTKMIINPHYIFICSAVCHLLHFLERVLITQQDLGFFMELLFLVLVTLLNFFLYWLAVGMVKGLIVGLGLELVKKKEEDSEENESTEQAHDK